jgi:hypothetical protein
MLLVCGQSRSLHFPLGHSVGAFSGAWSTVMLVVVFHVVVLVLDGVGVVL